MGMAESTGSDLSLLVPKETGFMELTVWFDSMKTIAEQLSTSSNENTLDPKILDILLDGLWITDKDDTIVFVNTMMSNLIGIPKDKIIGTDIINSHSSKIFEHFIPLYVRAKDERCPIQYEPIPVLTASGKMTHQTGWVIPRFADDHFQGIICSVSNITESRQLAHLKAKCQAICECSPDSIMLIEPTGKILYMNHALPGFFSKKAVGANLFSLFPEPYQDEIEQCLRRVEQSKVLDRYYLNYPNKDGGSEYIEARVAPIVAGEKVIAFVINSSNITKQKVLENELKRNQASLEETNITLKVLLKRIEKERLLFQENLSTNILCNIEPYMNKLKQSDLDKDQRRTLDILDHNIKDMASPLIYSVMTMNLRLTPAEMQISNFIRQGYSSKEIADLLNISPATIDKHRKNIRKKLGITNKKQNLRSVLSSLSS